MSTEPSPTATVSLDEQDVVDALAYRAIVKAGLVELGNYDVRVNLDVHKKTGKFSATVQVWDSTPPLEGRNGDRP